jgi:hypothetical protein
LNSATINTSEMNITSSEGAVYGYSGQPGVGNLYLAISAAAGTDNFGNTFSTGLNAQSGAVQGLSIVGSVIDATSTLTGSQIQQAQVLSPMISGGTSASMTHTMSNSGGPVLGYTSGATAITFSTAGLYSWTCPTGITSIQVQCWAAGGGGDGGSASQGGAGGGGGEYAAEPAFPVTPGNVYSIIVGAGGGGGSSGVGGAPGGYSSFTNTNGQPQSVTANGGGGGADFAGGQGGTGSGNTIHFDGGDGAGGSGNLGAAGGGSSASSGGEGNAGTGSSGNTGGVGGSGLSGGGAGGAGGNTLSNGVSGGAPGGGGGGAGDDSDVTVTARFQPNSGTYSYYGDNAMGHTPSSLSNHDGPLYQGQPSVNSAQGYQYSVMTLPYATIQSTLSGKTVSNVVLYIECLHSYYGGDTGMALEVGFTSQGSFGNSLVYPPAGYTAVLNYTVLPGGTGGHPLGLGGGIGVALQNGNCKALVFGQGAIAPWQDYYGYLSSGANGGFIPYILVYYSDGGVATAGSGGGGQVIVSYSQSTPAYTLSVSASASSDTYGNPYAVGFTGPLLTLTNQSSTAATNTAATSIVANTAGTPTATNSHGFSGQAVLTQTDGTLNQVTATVPTALSASYTVPAGDPQLGTLYRLSAWGDWHTAAAPSLTRWQVNVGGGSASSIILGGLSQTASTFYEWYATTVLQYTLTGSGGEASSWMSVNYGQFGVSLQTGSAPPESGGLAGAGFVSLSTLTASTLQLMGSFNVGASGQTIRCFGSSLERIGP